MLFALGFEGDVGLELPRVVPGDTESQTRLVWQGHCGREGAKPIQDHAVGCSHDSPFGEHAPAAGPVDRATVQFGRTGAGLEDDRMGGRFADAVHRRVVRAPAAAGVLGAGPGVERGEFERIGHARVVCEREHIDSKCAVLSD